MIWSICIVILLLPIVLVSLWLCTQKPWKYGKRPKAEEDENLCLESSCINLTGETGRLEANEKDFSGGSPNLGCRSCFYYYDRADGWEPTCRHKDNQGILHTSILSFKVSIRDTKYLNKNRDCKNFKLCKGQERVESRRYAKSFSSWLH